MPLYESTFIARPDISAQQVEALSEQFQEIVRGTGGEVPRTEYWGLRSLAFRIKKNRKGHYLFMQIDAPVEAVKEMERNMRINEDVMRYLTVRVDELDPNPSAQMSRGREGRMRGEGRRFEGEGRRSDRSAGSADSGGREKSETPRSEERKPASSDAQQA